jgi:hypothetical protein
MRFQLQLLLIEVHYSDEICGVYNGYLKSGSKQKLEKQRANLERERVTVEEGRRKKEPTLGSSVHKALQSFLLMGYSPSKKRMQFSGVYMRNGRKLKRREMIIYSF